MAPPLRHALASLAIAAALAVTGYYVYTQIQTQRGEQALAATQLDFRPLPDALAAARIKRLPVLVDFSAIWCPTCRRLHQTVFTDPAVKEAINRGYVLARVDYDAPEAAAFIKTYSVGGFPSLLVLDASGKLLRRLPVSFDAAAFVIELAPPES